MSQKITLVKSKDQPGFDIWKDGAPSICPFTQPLIMEAPGTTVLSAKVTIIRRFPCNTQCELCDIVTDTFVQTTCGCKPGDHKLADK